MFSLLTKKYIYEIWEEQLWTLKEFLTSSHLHLQKKKWVEQLDFGGLTHLTFKLKQFILYQERL